MCIVPNSVNTLAGFSPAARIIPAISGKSVPISPKAPESSLRSKRMRDAGFAGASMDAEVSAMRLFHRIEAYEYRLRMQRYAEFFFHAVLNVVLQRDDLRRGRTAAINNGQRVLAADAHSAAGVAAMKSGMLH